jgi:hypothetical protein
LTVNYNSEDFLKVLFKSIDPITPIVVVENSHTPKKYPRASTIVNQGEKTHGEGLNLGLKAVETEHVLILDVDCHIISSQWIKLFSKALEGYDVITVAGPPQKPIRPACVFMKTADAKKFDWRATPGYKGHRVTPEGFDVGIQAYRQMRIDGFKIKYMTTIKPSRYGTLNGEEYSIDDVALIYHHWHGSHLVERSSDYPDVDLLADKKKLLRQRTQLML